MNFYSDFDFNMTHKLRVYLLTSPVNNSTVDSDAPNTRRVKSPHKRTMMASKKRKPKLGLMLCTDN